MYDRAAAIARESKLFDEVEGPAAKETAMRLRLAVSNALFVQTSFLFAQVGIDQGRAKLTKFDGLQSPPGQHGVRVAANYTSYEASH